MFVGNYYGTPKKYVQEQLAAGKDVILEIEPENAKLIPAALAGCSLPERSANGKYLVKIKATDAGIWEFSVHNKVIAAGIKEVEIRTILMICVIVLVATLVYQ